MYLDKNSFMVFWILYEDLLVCWGLRILCKLDSIGKCKEVSLSLEGFYVLVVDVVSLIKISKIFLAYKCVSELCCYATVLSVRISTFIRKDRVINKCIWPSVKVIIHNFLRTFESKINTLVSALKCQLWWHIRF